MSEEKTRVEFDAPKSLVERIDTVAEVLDIPRTRLLIDALENKLDELATEETVRRRLTRPPPYPNSRTISQAMIPSTTARLLRSR